MVVKTSKMAAKVMGLCLGSDSGSKPIHQFPLNHASLIDESWFSVQVLFDKNPIALMLDQVDMIWIMELVTKDFVFYTFRWTNNVA